MALVLHYHPLASFCWKPLIALYENGTDFQGVIVRLEDAGSAAAFERIWPMKRFPVLVDDERQATVAESSVVIEYLDLHHAGASRFVPADPDAAWRVRMWDRFFDGYVAGPMQAIVANFLREPARRDELGEAQARATLHTAYGVAERQYLAEPHVRENRWTLADCAAAPALFYANAVEPFAEAHPALAHHLAELMARPAFARVLHEAEPYFKLFPLSGRISVDPASITAKSRF